jgi:hypothetical protein
MRIPDFPGGTEKAPRLCCSELMHLHSNPNRRLTKNVDRNAALQFRPDFSAVAAAKLDRCRQSKSGN